MTTQFLKKIFKRFSFPENDGSYDLKMPALLLIVLLQVSATGCSQPVPGSPSIGYNLTKPSNTYIMPAVLNEISGIAFNHANADTVYAEQDEEGKLFYFHLGDAAIKQTKFSKKGDYEDVAIANGQVIMLRSDGVFFTFPLQESGEKNILHTNEQAGLLQPGEYESLYADETNSLIYVLCKNCRNDKGSGSVTGYVFSMSTDGQLRLKNSFLIDEKKLSVLAGKPINNLKPSALAKNPLSHQWFILSSVNKILLIADSQWKLVGVYSLNPSLFTQPEGIAFDRAGNLYISNEKGTGQNGTILRFAYQKK